MTQFACTPKISANIATTKGKVKIKAIQKDKAKFLAFFAAAGLALVGAAPVFHNPFTHFGHVVGAWLAAVCGTLWAFLQYISM